MEHIMWNIYNILVIQTKKNKTRGKQLLCTLVLKTQWSLSYLTMKRVYPSFISEDADAEKM